MTIHSGNAPTWGNRASRAYSNAKQYGGTSVLWTFLIVVMLLVVAIVAYSNWDAVSKSMGWAWLTDQISDQAARAQSTIEPNPVDL